jgi:septum formation protein
MSAPLILASASPRRRELLSAAGVVFEVVPSDVPEQPAPGETAAVFARRVAREKALDVARRRPHAWVLAADTVVVVDGAIFGKPVDRDDGRRMLRALAGRVHQVLTAVVLHGPQAEGTEFLVSTDVEFRTLTAAEIDGYLETEEPFDKAGAYAVQGGARAFVRQVRGSYSNVVGLPMDEVAALLRRCVPHAARTAEESHGRRRG